MHKLETYNVDRSSLSVSGVSSGAIMASQLHVIYSSRIMGVGLIAGVPFACSGGTLAGLTTCMSIPSLESVSTMEALVSSGALFGNADATYHMRHDKVFIFNGLEDSVVHPGNGPNIARFYRHYIHDSRNIKTVFDMHTEHCMPTDRVGGPCTVLSKTNYLNNCGYNGAFELLNFIYGGHLMRPSGNTTLAGQVKTFNQAQFFTAAPVTYSLDNTGYIYIPSNCLDKSNKCKLHVALHGCKMGRHYINEDYVRNGGYNEVGELNDIIILYPQVVPTLLNPSGCWDGYGYTGAMFATNKGYQEEGLRRMMTQVMGHW
ncbi:uncharacterized protein LOC125683202 isoform X2 [Ostrea edulis]|uniref:uncharacterized protein LOC125683202 isoform X2 n=1 Tax=Ostrea edulis TaxID=37623 RepID=UPI0020957EBB|nr:uncharacterized protein LOC125683202 isoform X2 [Ostrea edulis]